MLFTKEFSGTVGIDFSQTSFNIIQINEDIRSNIFYVINNMTFCVFFYRKKGYLMQLAFVIAVENLIYKIGMLVVFYEFNKGYSDFLSISVMITFMVYDKVKWRF